MSENSTKSSKAEDEIDLSIVFKAIKDFFKKILVGIINIFGFYYKHKFVIIGLLAAGVVLGYLYEQNFDKTYSNDILVTPNYGSSDYLYTKIESLDLKFSQKDTSFTKSVFGQHHKLIKSIEIKPVVDIYNFVSRNGSNQALFELLFEEEANIEFIENPINSRNFKYHHIYLDVKGEEHHQELSASLIKYINSNTYFGDIKDLNLSNVNYQLEQNQYIIKQIDSIITFSKNNNSMTLGSSDISFTDNSGLSALLSKKKGFINQQQELQSTLVNQDEIIKVVDANYKVLNNENILIDNKKVFLPLFFFLIYSLYFLIRFIARKAKDITS